MADQEKLPHIPFQRENIERALRGRPNPTAPRVQPRDDRSAHGEKINKEIDQAVDDIDATRESLGIAPDRLRVLDFEIAHVDERELLIRTFDIAVVEELKGRAKPI